MRSKRAQLSLEATLPLLSPCHLLAGQRCRRRGRGVCLCVCGHDRWHHEGYEPPIGLPQDEGMRERWLTQNVEGGPSKVCPRRRSCGCVELFALRPRGEDTHGKNSSGAKNEGRGTRSIRTRGGKEKTELCTGISIRRYVDLRSKRDSKRRGLPIVRQVATATKLRRSYQKMKR